MKVLLDTNIIIHRESHNVVKSGIGILFRWLDQLGYEKCIHPLTIDEISKYKDQKIVNTFRTKIESYRVLKTIAPDTLQIKEIIRVKDKNENDRNDSTLLNELASRRVDILITEDRSIHKKAKLIGESLKIFTIDGFLEKVNAEYPDLAEYKVLSVKKEYFGNINLNDGFFDSFREDYPGFDEWFNKKADEVAYVCSDEIKRIVAFLYVKTEGERERYDDISPPLLPKKRLKIGTFKVISNGFKIGERFIKIIFDNALRFQVDEIYVTAFDRGDNKLRLIQMLKDWGFDEHGSKSGKTGRELVFTRTCRPQCLSKGIKPRHLYPYAPSGTKKWT